MEVMNLIESLLRWIHVVAGIVWIGHLYFFNWVNSQFEPTLDADGKKKVIPELRPRALYWFRWGAAFTWVTGVFLLLIVYYHYRFALADPVDGDFGAGAIIVILITFLAVFLYDALAKSVITDAPMQFWSGVIAAVIFVILAEHLGGFSFRGTAIHLGAMFGTTMAFNVWFRIWPAQQKIITAIKNGQATDAALVALAGGRSKHNTYMSVPLVFMMIGQHSTWAASVPAIELPLIVLVGFYGVYHLYMHAPKVKGF
jgi:uncharacterized membrane protein